MQELGPPANDLPDERVRRFKTCLKNEARTWISAQGAMTYEQLQARFLARYGRQPTEDEDQQTLANARLQPGQTYEAFAEKLETAGQRLNFHPNQIKRFFLTGLPEGPKVYVRGQNPQTLAEALIAAKTWQGLGV